MTKDNMLEAIRAFFGNTQLSREQTREGLEEAEELIDDLLNTLGDEDE